MRNCSFASRIGVGVLDFLAAVLARARARARARAASARVATSIGFATGRPDYSVQEKASITDFLADSS